MRPFRAPLRLHPMRRLHLIHRDERGFLLSTLIKIVIVLGLIALSAIEAGAILFAKFEVQDVADRAAIAAADALARSASCTQAATAFVHEQDRKIHIDAIECRTDGSARVDLSKRASTLVVHRITFFDIDHFARVKATGTGRPAEF